MSSMKQDRKEIRPLERGQTPDKPSFAMPDGSIVLVRRAGEDEIENMHGLMQGEIAMSTVPLSACKAVYNHNRDCIWGIYRSADATERSERLIGVYGFLHLNEVGHAALKRGELDASNPDLSLLSRDGERPSAIYIWGVVARGLLRIVTQLVAVALGKGLYGGLPYYATAGTMGGLNSIKRYGFISVGQDESGLGDLFRRDPPPAAVRNETEAA